MMNTPFKLGTFSIAGGVPFPGVVVDERVIAIAALEPICARLGQHLTKPDSVFGLLQAWDDNLAALQAALNDSTDSTDSTQSTSLSAVQVHAPVQYPRQIICAGANYKQHVIDLIMDQDSPEVAGMTKEQRHAHGTQLMEKRAANGVPYVFGKLVSAVAGPFDTLVLPNDATQPDWELELGVVIGKPVRRIARADALGVVAGYTIVNDITNRDHIYRPDLKAIGTDWIAGKSSPGYLPSGPFLVPACFVPDPQQLQITLKLNGDVMQDESTADMIFGVARLIEYISNLVQLWPGDLICSGSPKGNGTHFNRFLRAGDVMEGSITGLGTQRVPCAAEVAA